VAKVALGMMDIQNSSEASAKAGVGDYGKRHQHDCPYREADDHLSGYQAANSRQNAFRSFARLLCQKRFVV
jgi:hypothetical protein